MKKNAITKWVDQYLETEPPRAKSIVMTVFGDAITPHGGAIWLSSLIELMAPFGINDRLVRTSVFRLAEEGWLEAKREGRRSLYALTGQGAKRFERAYKRIYSPSTTPWDRKWTTLMIPSGMIGAPERGALRKELTWEGFSMIAPGVYAHPTGKVQVLHEVLERVNVLGKVFVCSTEESETVSSRPLSDLVEQFWDLGPLVADYQGFIDSFGSLAKTLKTSQDIDPEHAFVIRTLLIHSFRRISLHDPQLPLELLPTDWPGTAAYDLCRDIYLLSFRSAQDHVVSVLEKEGDKIQKPSRHFFERFGGLE